MKLKISDGQHRFLARKALGLPIYYIVNGDPQVKKTSRYNMFEFGSNREIRESNLKRLTRSILKKDLGEQNPIKCGYDYSLDDVLLENSNTFRWKIEDYVKAKALMGDSACQEILDDAKKYEVPINVFMAAIGVSASAESIVSGRTVYSDKEKKLAKDLFSELGIFGKYKFSKTLRFVKAYKAVRRLNNFEFKKMQESIKKHPSDLTLQRSRTNYLFNLLDVYNYGRAKWNRVPYPAQDIFEDWGDA